MNKKIVGLLLVSIFIFACSDKALPIKKLNQSSGFSVETIFIEETTTNVYILSNGKKECIIIDPAIKTKQIAKTLTSNKYKAKAIFLTHNHFDHSTGVIELSKILKIPVITNYKQIKMGESPLGKPLAGKNLIKVSNRQMIKFANINIDIIFTPGHSLGSMCFYHEASNFLFSGDTLFKESIGRTDFPGSEKEKIIDSVITVLSAVKPDTIIYPGHGKRTTKKHELMYNPFLTH